MKKSKLLWGLVTSVIVVVSAIVLTACGNVATTSATCGFIVGTGGESGDANVHEVVYPGQKATAGNNETVKYIPCNSRNYIINPEGRRNANGDPIGDYHEPINAVTSNGTRVKMWLTATWTPNQDRKVMENYFYPFCEKYQCFSDNQEGEGNINSASPGWNSMLGENMPFTLESSARQVLPSYSDAVWKEDRSWSEIAEKMSENFADNFRKQTGFGADLICGSGDVSGWNDPKKPGEGEFQCGNVRIVINSIVPADSSQGKLVEQKSKAQLEDESNQAALKAAKAKYGSRAGYWLGLQDTIDRCKAENVKCVVTFGNGSGTVVQP